MARRGNRRRGLLAVLVAFAVSVAGMVPAVAVDQQEQSQDQRLAVNPARVSIDGSLRVGTPLTVRTKAVWPTDTTVEVAWFKGGHSIGQGQTYRAAPSDSGATVRAEVTFTREGFETYVVSRDVQIKPYPGLPEFAVNASPRVDRETCVEPYGTVGRTEVSAVWMVDGEPLEGGEGQCWTPTAEDLGAAATVAITAKRPGYPDALVEVSAQDEVREGSLGADFSSEIVYSFPIGSTAGDSGEPAVRVATYGSYQSRDIQWLRNGQPISGATSARYVPTKADAGADLSATVRLRREGYEDKVRTVEWNRFTKTPAPVITGEAKIGELLKVQMPQWKPAPAELSYEWYADGEIVGVGPSLRVRSHFARSQITVHAVATRPDYELARVESAPTAAVPKATIQVQRAYLEGEPRVGGALTAIYAASPSSAWPRITWLRDGVPIDGAFGRRYKVQRADAGAEITARIQIQQVGYHTTLAWAKTRIPG